MIDLAGRLRALPQPGLRLRWFVDWSRRAGAERAALAIEVLLSAADSFTPSATPGLITLAAWQGSACDEPTLHQICQVAQGNALPHTEELTRGIESSSQDLARELLQPVPDYGRGRNLTLGERKSLARRMGRGEIDRWLRDPHPQVIKQLLINPRLKESDVVRLATLKPASPSALTHLFRDTRWLMAPRVRSGILLNTSVVVWQARPLLWLCTRPELERVSASPNLGDDLRSSARHRLSLLPPIARARTHATVH